MHLNQDCIRELLLFVEKSPFNKILYKKDLKEFIDSSNFTEEEVIYCIQKLSEANFIKGKVLYASNEIHEYYISAITYNGHEFLDNVKNKTIWEKAKSTAKTIGSTSLDILSKIAANIIMEKLQN